ncbi:MAG: hypothetical protein WA210_19610 [Burkholderiaceae bacterium]
MNWPNSARLRAGAPDLARGRRELPENNTLYALAAAALAQFPYIRDSVYGRRAFA